MTTANIDDKNSWFFEKCFGFYVSLARRVWRSMSAGTQTRGFGRAYGRHIDRVVRRFSDRKQYFATFFLRNRPELQLISRLLERKPVGSRADIAVVACSKGPEVYSIAWAIRKARPDLDLRILAVDISREILDFASKGVYSLARPDSSHPQTKSGVSWNTSRDQENAWMFERMSSEEISEMFDVSGDEASIKPYLREGITWMCGDASDPRLNAGRHEIVVANRFLCHMRPAAATACLRNLGTLVQPGGYLFVYGLDLDVRTNVALEMGWQPVRESIREIHDGDESLRSAWPLQYWGLEPLDDTLPEWEMRYASVFRIGNSVPPEREVLAETGYAGR
jgi:chemotaxis methyl-accepting protein methylase